MFEQQLDEEAASVALAEGFVGLEKSSDHLPAFQRAEILSDALLRLIKLAQHRKQTEELQKWQSKLSELHLLSRNDGQQ